MKTRKIALLIDIDNVKIGKEAIEELFVKLKEVGDVVYCKFYGYNDRKHIYLSELISNYGYETAPFMRLKKRFSQLDNRMIVDAVKINYTKPEINNFCFVAGNGDLIPALVEIKSCGKTVIDVNTEFQDVNKHMYDEHIMLDNIDDEVEVYGAKPKQEKAKAKPAPKVSAKPEYVAPRPAPVYAAPKQEYVAPRPAPVYAAPKQEYVAPRPAPVYAAPKQEYVAPKQPEYVAPKQEVKQEYVAARPQQAPAKPVVEERTPYTQSNVNYSASKSNSIYGGNYQDDDLDNYIEDEVYDEPDDYDLSDVLQDITERYNELDFSNDENMSEKLKLIEDIESLIESENNKGEGMNSSNTDMRQIFNDLQEIVDEMKSSL